MPSFSRHRFPLRTGATVFLAALVIGGYALFEARRFIQGPVIEVTSPVPGVALTDRLVELRANTRNVASISVNGRPTYVTEEGLLQEPLWLQEGYTVLTIAAKDRFGHTTQEVLELYAN